MPNIPLPVSTTASTFRGQALSIPEYRVRATGDAFGENIANAELSGLRRVASAQEDASKAESSMWNKLGTGIITIAGEQIQKDWKLQAEKNMQDLSLGMTARQEKGEATGDGSYTRDIIAGFDENAQELIANASSPYQANIYREGLQRVRFQHERTAIAAEAAAVKQTRIDNANRLTEAAEVDAFRDPSRLQEVRDRTIDTISSSALSPRQRTQMVEKFDRRIHAQVIESHIIAGRIGAAQAMLKDDQTISALGGIESVKMQARVQKAAEELADRQKAAALMASVARGEARLDPQSKDHRRMLDDAWAAVGADRQLAESNQNAAIGLANVAKTYGIVPPAPLSLLNGMALNGSVEQQAFALQTVAMVEAAHPGIVKNSGAHATLQNEAGDFRFWSVAMGLTPDEAVKRIQATRTSEFKAAHDARKKDANKLVSSRTDSELANAFDNSWKWDASVGGDPRTKDVLVSAYRRAFTFHYERTGEEQTAIAAAQADLKRTYGLTTISGDPGWWSQGRVMKNPLELRLPAVDQSYEWAAKDLDAFVKGHNGGKDVPRKQRFYESVRETDVSISRGQGPVYAVSWFDPDKKSWTMAPELWRPNFVRAKDAALTAAAAQRAKNVGKVGGDVPAPFDPFAVQP